MDSIKRLLNKLSTKMATTGTGGSTAPEEDIVALAIGTIDEIAKIQFISEAVGQLLTFGFKVNPLAKYHTSIDTPKGKYNIQYIPCSDTTLEDEIKNHDPQKTVFVLLYSVGDNDAFVKLEKYTSLFERRKVVGVESRTILVGIGIEGERKISQTATTSFVNKNKDFIRSRIEVELSAFMDFSIVNELIVDIKNGERKNIYDAIRFTDIITHSFSIDKRFAAATPDIHVPSSFGGQSDVESNRLWLDILIEVFDKVSDYVYKGKPPVEVSGVKSVFRNFIDNGVTLGSKKLDLPIGWMIQLFVIGELAADKSMDAHKDEILDYMYDFNQKNRTTLATSYTDWVVYKPMLKEVSDFIEKVLSKSHVPTKGPTTVNKPMKITSNTIIVLVTGDNGVGKKSLVNFLAKGRVPAKLDKVAHTFRSYGNIFFNIEFRYSTESTLESDIRYASTQTNHIYIILVFDVNEDKTFDDISNFADIIKKVGNPVGAILLGNKIDIENKRSVSQKRAQSWAQANGGIPYYEASAKEGVLGSLIKQIISSTGLVSSVDLDTYTKQSNILLNRDEFDSRFFSTDAKYHYPQTIPGKTELYSEKKWQAAVNLFFEFANTAYDTKGNDSDRRDMLSNLYNDIVPFRTTAEKILDIPVGWAIQLTLMIYIQMNPRARLHRVGLLDELQKQLITGDSILEETVRSADKSKLSDVIDGALNAFDQYLTFKTTSGVAQTTGVQGPVTKGRQPDTKSTTLKPRPLFDDTPPITKGSVQQNPPKSSIQVETKLKQQPLFESPVPVQKKTTRQVETKLKQQPLFDVVPTQKPTAQVEVKLKEAPLFDVAPIQIPVAKKEQSVKQQPLFDVVAPVQKPQIQVETKIKQQPLFGEVAIQKPKTLVEIKIKQQPLFGEVSVPKQQEQSKPKQLLEAVPIQKQREVKLKQQPLFQEIKIPMTVTKPEASTKPTPKPQVSIGVGIPMLGGSGAPQVNKQQQQQLSKEDDDLKQAEFNSLKTRIEELEKMLAEQKSTMLTTVDADAYAVMIDGLLSEIDANKKKLESKKQPPKQRTTNIKLPKEIEASISHVVSLYDYMFSDTLKVQRQSAKRFGSTNPNEFDTNYFESTADTLYNIFKWEPLQNPIASVLFNTIYHISNADPALFRKQAISFEILNYDITKRSEYTEKQFLLTALLYNSIVDDMYSELANKIVVILEKFYKTLQDAASKPKPLDFGDKVIDHTVQLYQEDMFESEIIVKEATEYEEYPFSVKELLALAVPFVLSTIWIGTEIRSFCKHFFMHVDPGVIGTIFYMIDYIPGISAENKMMLYNCVAMAGSKYLLEAADLFVEKMPELGDPLYGILVANFRRIIPTTVSEFVDSLYLAWKAIYEESAKINNEEGMFFAAIRMINALVDPHACLSMALSMFSRVKFDRWEIGERDMARKFEVGYKNQYTLFHFTNTAARYYFNHAMARAVENLDYLIHIIDLVSNNSVASAAAQAVAERASELTWFEGVKNGAIEAVKYMKRNVVDILYILHLSGKRVLNAQDLSVLFNGDDILNPLDNLFENGIPFLMDLSTSNDSAELEGCINAAHKVKALDKQWYDKAATLFSSYLSSVAIDSHLVKKATSAFNKISTTLSKKCIEIVRESVSKGNPNRDITDAKFGIGPFNRPISLETLLLNIDTTKHYTVSIEKSFTRLVENIKEIEDTFGIIGPITNVLNNFFGPLWHANLLLYTFIDNLPIEYWFIIVHMMSNEATELRTVIKQTLALEGPFSEQAKVLIELAEELEKITTLNIGEKTVIKPTSLLKPNTVITTTEDFDAINFEKWRVIVDTYDTLMGSDIDKMAEKILSISTYSVIKRELKIFGKYAASTILEDFKKRGETANTLEFVKSLTEKSSTLFFTMLTKSDTGKYSLTGFDDIEAGVDDFNNILKSLEKLLIVATEISIVGRFGNLYTPSSGAYSSIIIDGMKYIDIMEKLYNKLVENYATVLKANAVIIQNTLETNDIQTIFSQMGDSDKTLKIKVDSPPINFSATLVDVMSGVNTDSAIVLRRDLYNVAKHDGSGKDKALIWRVTKKMIEKTGIIETIKKQKNYTIGEKEYKPEDAEWKTNLPKYIATALRESTRKFKEIIETDILENKWITNLSENMLTGFVTAMEKERSKILSIANDKLTTGASGIKLYEILPPAIKPLYKPMYLNPPNQPSTSEYNISQEQASAEYTSGFGFRSPMSKFKGVVTFS